MPDPVEVAVIGGGLAGTHAFRLLAGRGVRTALIERKASVASPVHTTGVFVRKTLEDFDLPRELLGPPVSRVRLYGPSGRCVEIGSTFEEFRAGDMGRLYERFARQGVRNGGELMTGVSLIGMRRERGCVVLDLRRGTERFEMQARFVIGADGSRSRVARVLGLDVNRRFLVGAERVYESLAVPNAAPMFHCVLDPAVAPGYLAWLIQDGERVHVGTAGVRSARFDAKKALDEVERRFARLAGLAPGRASERRGGLIPVGGVLRRIACPGGLLVGDAAGAVSPLTAGGLDGALRLTGLAVDVAAAYLATGNPRSLARYDGGAFRTRFASRLGMRMFMERVRSPALMNAAMLALSTPPGRAAAWHVFFARNSFPDPAEVGQRRLAMV